ncbi:hypothetical protein [Desulfosporosinus sp. FKA]|uniref:hypothetical protein n=1 Tax=Desulfosporosinus sp. FKA TaxID=1969834 RepID=UPI000B4984CA|nr:hypothetical protein [Desulfosporosinus sp. FKA]
MQMNDQLKEDLFLTLDYIRNLFIRNEDEAALKELDSLFQKMECMIQEMTVRVQETIRQLLLQASKSLETKDYVRLMDILIFEVKPLLKD